MNKKIISVTRAAVTSRSSVVSRVRSVACAVELRKSDEDESTPFIRSCSKYDKTMVTKGSSTSSDSDSDSDTDGELVTFRMPLGGTIGKYIKCKFPDGTPKAERQMRHEGEAFIAHQKGLDLLHCASVLRNTGRKMTDLPAEGKRSLLRIINVVSILSRIKESM